MPNYTLVANSTFQPFTYQELMAPVQLMSNYHEKLAEEYDKLSSQADLLEALGKTDKETPVYSQYKNYSEALKKEADDLYAKGLTSESRHRLSDLRRRYNAEIVPIQNAWNKREEEIKAQQQARLANPSLRFTRIAADTGLQSYIDNPTGGYGVVNLDAITNDMKTAAANLAKEIRAGKQIEGIDATHYNYIKKYGLDSNVITSWMNNPNSNPKLKSMMNGILAKHGITPEALAKSPNGAALLIEGEQAAKNGAWYAIGEDKEHILEDDVKKMNMQAAKELYVYGKKKEIDAEYARAQAGSTSAVINPSNIYSSEEAVEQNKRIKEYEKYFTRTADGRTILNKDGIKEYNRNATPDASYAQSGGATARLINAETNLEDKKRKFTPTKFREFIDEIGGAEVVKKRQYGNLGNLWNQYKTKDFLKYDATKLTEYNHNIDPSEYTNWTDRIRERANGQLEEVEWDKKQKKWVSKGTAKISDVFKKGSNPTSTQSSIYGRTFRVVDENGNVKRYRMPRGINSRAEENIDNHLRALSQVQALTSQLNSNGEKILTYAEAQELNRAIGTNVFAAGTVINYPTLQKVNTDLEDRLATFESQMGVTNTNKPQEWGAISY